MKRTLIVSILTLFFFAGCRKETPLKSTMTTVTEDSQVTAAKERLTRFINDNHVKPRYAVQSEVAPAQASSKRGKSHGLSLNADYNHYQGLIERAINADDYECEPTKLDDWVIESIQTWTFDDFLMFNSWGGIVFDYVYVFENSNGGQSYGPNGEYSKANNNTFKELLGFWDIPTNILLRDCHSASVYSDVSKIVKVLKVYSDLGFIPPLSDSEYNTIAGDIKTVFGSAHFRYYKHPLLSLNAFAAPVDEYFATPKKIVMGDGIMEVYDDLGFEDVAPQAILAHEYGHQVQFANNVVFGPLPEDTRSTELMADALAAYYLTHKSGANMNWKRVKQFLEVFYIIGDCAFDNPGHHGTPNQRMKAAEFGYQVASDNWKKGKKFNGKIVVSAEFIAMFNSALADIVAPD